MSQPRTTLLSRYCHNNKLYGYNTRLIPFSVLNNDITLNDIKHNLYSSSLPDFEYNFHIYEIFQN